MGESVNLAMKRAAALAAAFALLLAACSGGGKEFHPSAVGIKTYKDIRGVTAGEAAAIEAMASARDTFVYGHILEKEPFRLPDGTFSGFTVDVFEFLGAFLGVTFVPRHFEEPKDLAESLDMREIDIACGVSNVPERSYISAPIAGRRMDLSYTHVTLVAVNDKLEPAISVFNKYLRAGGTAKIFELYEKGETEYRKQLLYSAITDGERAYIDSVKARGGIVPVGFQHDAYPSCFYNHVEKKYQGIAPDILAEVTKLTGLSFEETVTTRRSTLAEMLQQLKSGELSIVTQVLYSESRDGDFIWSAAPYLSTRYALISRLDFPKVDNYRVYYHRIGLVDRSVHAEVFDKWFPNHEHKTLYATGNELFDALENGDLCMAMASENMLWAMTNFREKTGYKVNVSFDDMQDARFGYNKKEVALRNIVDKVMELTDVDEIRGGWMNRTFDYTKKITRQSMYYAAAVASIAVVAALVLVALLRRNTKLRKTLLDESSKLSTVFSAIPDIVYCMDINMRYTSVNSAFELFVGKLKSDIIGKDNRYVFADKSGMAEYFTEMNAKVLREQKTMAVQEWATTFDGVKTFLEVVKTPLYINGALAGLIGIARDITAHKAAEAKAVEASKVKSQFLANMSHEIRTPLNAIIGMSELLSMEQLSSRQRHYVKDIGMASYSLLSIINDILDFSKIEAGKLDLNPVDYDFGELIANLKSMFRFMARKKNLSFEYEEGENGLPKCLHGDDMRLRQVLINLCANAVNYTECGLVRLKIIDCGDRLTFEIKDTGAGMKQDELANLFSPFTSGDSAKNRSVVGTGLGLSISKTFVDMMDGTITARSEFGKGSVFTVTVPKIPGDESKIVRVGAGSGKASFSAPDARVLVVDDNSLNLKVAFRLLGLYGITADMVSSGREAILAVRKSAYDIVFMDHMMPEMNGIQATAQIRALGGDCAKLPIIALTANATRGVQEMFLASGLDDYIPKPIELDKLSEMLKKWIPIEKVGGAARDALYLIGEPDAGDGSFWEDLGRVDGINAEIAKHRVAGIEDMYKETLELFYDRTPRDCEELAKHLNVGSIENFAVLVHGMKSSLSTIGAMGLSEAAFELEKAGKAGDKKFCVEALPEFLEQLNALCANLAPLCGFEAAPKDRKKGNRERLEEKLKSALGYAEAYDGDKGIEDLEGLLKYDYGDEMNDVLKSVRSAFKNYDFEEAVKLLKKGTGMAAGGWGDNWWVG